MKQIELIAGRGITLVDDADYDHLSQFRWYNVRGYARRVVTFDSVSQVRKWRYMHQDVIGDAPSGEEIDHIHGNKLDNRRSELRFVTRMKQMSNWHGPTKRSKSRVLGVWWEESRNRWVAVIMRNRRRRMKRFKLKVDAIEWRQRQEVQA